MFEDAVFAEGWAGADLDTQYRRGLVYVVGRGADAIHARDRAHRAELEACEITSFWANVSLLSSRRVPTDCS